MTREALHNTIRSRFKTLVSDVESVTTQYDNSAQEPPDDAVWMRLNIDSVETRAAELGANKKHRTQGLMTVQIFSKPNTGTKSALELVDAIVAAFQSQSASGVVFLAVSDKVIGYTSHGWQTNVTCEFYFDE